MYGRKEHNCKIQKQLIMGKPVYYQQDNTKRYVDQKTFEALLAVGLIVKIRSFKKDLYLAV